LIIVENFEENCIRFGECTYAGAKFIYPIIMIVYVLLTHVLLLNLLIAMFTKRYSRMEHISKQLWAMQKFGLVKSFSRAPPLPFPYVVVWPFYSVLHLIYRTYKNKPQIDTPFCYAIDETKQRRIVNWQKFRSLDYLHRHPTAYSQMRSKARGGKGDKNDWEIVSDVKKKILKTPISLIGAKMATDLIETRLVGLEMRLAMANFPPNTSDQAQPKYTPEDPSVSRYRRATRIVSLEDGGKVISRSQSRQFGGVPELRTKNV
ncbi:unnamed protein product, partial [Hymenolepis diminuta]